MDAENESRPLLHSFEHETWRSRMRKRCFRIPSEITITGIILGLFLIVVTSLIMLENLQSTKENEIKLDEKLLASPFKYNKKALDPSWQDKRDSVKDKKNIKERKWDQINKSWKYVSDPSGLLLKSTRENRDENGKDEDVNDEVSDFIDEYGKELDDSWEVPLQLGMSKLDSLKDLSEDEDQIKKTILSSKLKLKEIDDGWKTLSEQGWKDKEIRKALFMALKDRRKSLETSDDVLQSPMNVDQIWQSIKDSWNKYLHKGDKESENQKSINDDWKSKMNLLQSPKSPDHKEKKNHKSGKESFDGRMNDTDVSGDLSIGQITKIMDLIDSSKVKWKKIDNGWRKLTEQGWKERDIKRALVQALLNRNEAVNDSSVLQSPMNFNDLFDEISKKWNKGGGGGGKDHQGINNDWKNKMNILRSPQASDKKWKKVHDGWKSLNNHEWKNKDNEDASVDAWKDSEDPGQSPMSAPSILGELAFLVSSLFKKGSDNSQSQKNTNDKWAKQMSTFQSPKSSDKKWKKDKGKDKGTQSDQSVSNKDVEKALISALKETEKLLQVPEDFEKFLDDVIQIIKDLQANETNSRKNGNDDQVSENRENLLQASMPGAHNKWKERDDGLKKLSEQGWSDKEIRDALDKAWKDGDKIKQSSNGSMKWKKVNDGWKKIYNKS